VKAADAAAAGAVRNFQMCRRQASSFETGLMALLKMRPFLN
jgi:hypothetical protein